MWRLHCGLRCAAQVHCADCLLSSFVTLLWRHYGNQCGRLLDVSNDEESRSGTLDRTLEVVDMEEQRGDV